MFSKSLMVLSVLFLFCSQIVLAGDPAVTLPACTQIVKDCESKGFEPGMHRKDGQGLWADCIGAIAHGKTIAGVSDSQSAARGCIQAKKAAWQGKAN